MIHVESMRSQSERNQSSRSMLKQVEVWRVKVKFSQKNMRYYLNLLLSQRFILYFFQKKIGVVWAPLNFILFFQFLFIIKVKKKKVFYSKYRSNLVFHWLK
jgi:hypothetical protein